MSSMSDYLEVALLNAVLRNTSYTSPNPVYLALFTTPTTDVGGGTEVVGGSYVRQVITFVAPTSGVGSCANAGPSPVSFPLASADWGTVTHFGIYDAVSGGNRLMHNPLTAPVVVENGDTCEFPPGTVIASFG